MIHKSKVVVQDSHRESKLIRMLGLNPVEGRLGADACDDFNNNFELKTTSKDGVSTARDFHQGTIDKYSKLYWIIGAFDPHDQHSDAAFKDLFFLAPCHLMQWYEKMSFKLNRWTSICNMTRTVCQNADFDNTDFKELNSILIRGAKMNDPNIPMSYVRQYGIKMSDDLSFLPQQLKVLVGDFPILEKSEKPKEEFSFCFF